MRYALLIGAALVLQACSSDSSTTTEGDPDINADGAGEVLEDETTLDEDVGPDQSQDGAGDALEPDADGSADVVEDTATDVGIDAGADDSGDAVEEDETGDDPELSCLDTDNDDHGPNCLAGPDCAPDDGNHWADCDNCSDSDGDDRGDACDLGPDCAPDDGNHWADCDACTDTDEDGRGADCDLGDDCAPDDPAHWSDCGNCDDSDEDDHGPDCDLGEDCATADPAHWSDCGVCDDNDGDERGPGCDLGEDCGEDDPNNWVSCDTCQNNDADPYYAGCDRYETIDGPDCNQSTGEAWQRLAGYRDVDLDGYGTDPVSICAGEELPPNSTIVALQGDCAPTDPAHWDDCDVCVDGDFDGYGTDCNWGADCDDTTPLANQSLPEIPFDGIDNDCAGGDLTALTGEGVFVDPDLGQPGDPGTREEPLDTIAAAIAVSGGTLPIFIRSGEYTEVLTTSVSLHGGFASDWTRGSEPSPSTVIVAEAASGLGVDGDSPIAITGITLRGGTGGDSEALLYASDIVVAHSRIEGPTAGNRDEAFTIEGRGSLTLVDNEIVLGVGRLPGNRGIVAAAPRAILVGNHVYGDPAVQINHGMGMELSEGVAFLINNMIDAGDCRRSCSGLVGHSDLVLIHNTIVPQAGDLGNLPGRALLVHRDLYAVNNIFALGDNVAAPGAEVIRVGAFPNMSMAYNLFYDPREEDACLVRIREEFACLPTVEALEACDWAGCETMEGVVNDNPEFVSLSDHHLSTGSPAIGAGSAITEGHGLELVGEDIDGDVRPSGDWDLGADQHTE